MTFQSFSNSFTHSDNAITAENQYPILQATKNKECNNKSCCAPTVVPQPQSDHIRKTMKLKGGLLWQEFIIDVQRNKYLKTETGMQPGRWQSFNKTTWNETLFILMENKTERK